MSNYVALNFLCKNIINAQGQLGYAIALKVLGLNPHEVTDQVRKGNVTLCIVGLGYVGLPLATLFALEGAKVIGCDKREEVVRSVTLG
ncbi:MAG: hypothetical protein QXF26_06690, partial [Candidatus Bathyarchaeia archaeon]